MTDDKARAALCALTLTLTLTACGPSAEEVRLASQREELRRELAEQKQYNADLKLRMQLAERRGKVLVDLVKGLTSDPAAQPADATLTPAHSSLQELDADLEALIAGVQHSRADIDALRNQRAALVAELAQAKHTIEDARNEEAESQTRAQAFREMLEKLSSLIDHGDLHVRIVDNRMLVQLPESVLFKSNDAHVTREGKLLLDRVAEVLKSVATRQFQIAGHTDSLPIRYGQFKDNWELSSARALRVTQYLIERGVPRERLSAAAHADTAPIASEATPAGRRQNRRIEIVLLPNLEELPDLSSLSALLHEPVVTAEGEAAAGDVPEPAQSTPVPASP